MNNIFYTPPDRIVGQRLELTGQEAHHAAKVLRYREGDQITAVDGKGGYYRGSVAQIDSGTVVVQIEETWTEEAPKRDIRLGLGIIKKKDRLEFAVEKAVELGVNHLYLFPAEHSEKERVRADRLESVVIRAMKQSLRAVKPGLEKSSHLDQTMTSCSDYLPVIALQGEQPIEQTIGTLKNQAKLLLLVGPEGGFSSREKDRVVDRGGVAVSLGSRRLRAETAAITLLAMVTYGD